MQHPWLASGFNSNWIPKSCPKVLGKRGSSEDSYVLSGEQFSFSIMVLSLLMIVGDTQKGEGCYYSYYDYKIEVVCC